MSTEIVIGPALQKYYREADLMKFFGTLSPSLKQRSDHADMIWSATLHEIDTAKHGIALHEIRTSLREKVGPLNMENRGTKVKFLYDEDLTWFLLSFGQK